MFNSVGSDEKNCNKWYALYTKPRSEFKAALQLASLDIQYYLPTIVKERKWSDRTKKITEPLLRGYIFIFASEKERAISVEQDSIVRCIFDQGKPARIPDWQIQNLKKMLEYKYDYFTREGVVPGVKVRIKEGPFENVIGTVQGTDNDKTIAVTIQFLNRSVLAHLPRESVIEVLNDHE